MQIKGKFKLKRFISSLLIFCLAISPAVPAYGANSDISGHWAEETLKKWNEKN